MSAQQGMTQAPFSKLMGKSDFILKQGDRSPWSMWAVHLDWVRGLIGWSLLSAIYLSSPVTFGRSDQMGSFFWASKVCMWYRRFFFTCSEEDWEHKSAIVCACLVTCLRTGLMFSYREQLCLRWGKCAHLLNLVENPFQCWFTVKPHETMSLRHLKEYFTRSGGLSTINPIKYGEGSYM